MTRQTSIRATRVAVVVDSLEGHRPLYLRLILDHAETLGADVTIHCSGDRTTLDLHGDLRDRAEWHFSPSSPDLAMLDAEHIVLLDGDSVARSTFSTFRWSSAAPIVALSLRGQAPSWQKNPRRALKSLARFVVARRLHHRRNVQVLTLASAAEPITPGDDKVRDPIPISCTPEDVLRFQEDVLAPSDPAGECFWIGILGILNPRKCVEMVTTAIIEAASAGQIDGPAVLFAGPVADESRHEVNEAVALLQAADIPVVLIDELLNETTFDAAIGAMGAVVVAYRNDGPSAILGRAARLGTRVVAAGSPTLRSDVEALGIGHWGSLDVAGIRMALALTARQDRPEPNTEIDDRDFGPRILHRRPLRILAWPAFRHRWGNPFTAELADHLVGAGNQVQEFGLTNNLLRRHDAIVMHWPEFASTHRSRVIRWTATPLLLIVLFGQRHLGSASLIWVAHNSRPHDDRSPRLHRWFMRRFIASLDGVVALNQTGLHDAESIYPALGKIPNLVTRHPAYDMATAAVVSTDSMSPVGELLAGLDPQAPVLVSWGKILPYKQLDALAEQASRLDDGVVTVIAGRCDHERLAVQLLERSATDPDRLRVLIGHLADADLAALLERADAAVFNFEDITNSGSVIASLSAGVPVIAPRHPGLEELQVELGGDWVRLFDAPLHTGDLEKLMCIGPPTSPGIGDRSEFRWSTVAAEFEAFIRGVVGHQSPEGPR